MVCAGRDKLLSAAESFGHQPWGLGRMPISLRASLKQCPLVASWDSSCVEFLWVSTKPAPAVTSAVCSYSVCRLGPLLSALPACLAHKPGSTSQLCCYTWDKRTCVQNKRDYTTERWSLHWPNMQQGMPADEIMLVQGVVSYICQRARKKLKVSSL